MLITTTSAIENQPRQKRKCNTATTHRNTHEWIQNNWIWWTMNCALLQQSFQKFLRKSTERVGGFGRNECNITRPKFRTKDFFVIFQQKRGSPLRKGTSQSSETVSLSLSTHLKNGSFFEFSTRKLTAVLPSKKRVSTEKNIAIFVPIFGASPPSSKPTVTFKR